MARTTPSQLFAPLVRFRARRIESLPERATKSLCFRQDCFRFMWRRASYNMIDRLPFQRLERTVSESIHYQRISKTPI